MSGAQLHKQRITVLWKVFPMEKERLFGCENIIDAQFGYA